MPTSPTNDYHSPSLSSSTRYSSDDSMSGSFVISSTPLKKRSQQPQPKDAKEERALIRAELGPYTHYDVSLIEFAVHVWGIDREHVESILKLDLALDEEAYKEYNRVLHTGPEPDMYKPFSQLGHKLLSDIAAKAPHLPSPPLPLGIWEKKGTVYFPTATGDSPLKPDMTFFIGPPPKKPIWPLTKNPAEFKLYKLKTETKASGSKTSKKLSTVQEDVTFIPEYPSFSSATPSHGSGPVSITSAGRVPSFSSAIPSHVSNPVNIASAGGVGAAKRKRGDDGPDQGENTSKRSKQTLREMEVQAASYVRECFASTSRYYVVCLVIANYRVTVIYVDRTLSLQVTEFSFRSATGIKQLALTLYGLAVSNRQRAGFDPHLHAWPPQATATSPDKETPVETPVGSFFEFKRQRVEEDPPSDAEGEQCATMEPCRFRISNMIRRSKDLIGRATVVYDVQEVFAGNKLSYDHYALKLSWPLQARVDEIHAITHLHSVIPELADHLPALHFSDSLTASDLDLPWTKLNLAFTAENHQQRVLRILVEKLYSKLWKAGSVEAFKQAWLDCVECHFQAWEEGDVLHRDLSENNLMLYVGKDGKVKGVLNDWDMASFKDALGRVDRLLAAHHRTGTPPFMAIDLLDQPSPPHLYRHELESLFYILLWGALHYDVVAGIRHPTLEVVEEWEQALKSNRKAKANFFDVSREGKKALDSIRPEFQSLRKEWIEPLYRLIRDARNSVPDELGTPDPDYDYDTYDGRLTFWTFMAAIKQKPRWAKKKEEAKEQEKEQEKEEKTKEKDN